MASNQPLEEPSEEAQARRRYHRAPAEETPRTREAYRCYVKLGLNRSLPALYEQLKEEWGERHPSLDTLRAWSGAFAWQQRSIEDDEMINRRAMDRIRERMAQDIERRRALRLQLSDIQIAAAAAAMVENQQPRNLLDMNPATLRAINETAKNAGDTQRLDSGMANIRIAGAPNDDVSNPVPIANASEAILDELLRFIDVRPMEDNDPLPLPPPAEDAYPEDAE